ncbi:MAG: GAF domain-containing protein [Cytophagales bacterium]|nr:GAF domain-containing protein [Bernardetiaceae bacterium]MDW8204141.1 GAF domain-containing protein [Cytophagales bacterium]
MQTLSLRRALTLYLAISIFLIVVGGFFLRQSWINRVQSENLFRRRILQQASTVLFECSYLAFAVMRNPQDDNLRNQLSISKVKMENILRILIQGGVYGAADNSSDNMNLQPAEGQDLINMQQLAAEWQSMRKVIDRLESNAMAANMNNLNPIEYRNQMNAIADFLYQNVTKMNRNIEIDIAIANVKVNAEERNAFIWLYVYSFVMLINSIVGFVYFRDYVVTPLEKIGEKVQLVADGKQTQTIELSKNSPPEIAQLNNGINELSEIQNTMAVFASEVGKGNYNYQFTARSEADTLGIALLAMRDNLMRADREDTIRTWANEGQVKFGDIFRQYANDLEAFAYHSVAELVKYVGANQGFFFVLRDQDKEKPYLELIAAYAYEKRKYLHKQVPVGSGLLGQAVLEKHSLYFTDIPQNYVYITSGLGEATPGCLMIVPLMINDVVYGAIEIASFEPFEHYKIDFIEKIASNIAGTLAFAQNSEQTQRLLAETQSFAEQLRAQEEEMRQNMEELVATQEEMQRVQAEIRKKEAGLTSLINNTDTYIFSIDKGFNLLLANDAFKKYIKITYGIELQVGMNMLYDIVPETNRALRRKQYERALAGESFTVIENHKGKDHSDNYYEISFQPIFNQANQVEGLSVFMRNITHLNPIRWES